jgi:hypothetical protein
MTYAATTAFDAIIRSGANNGKSMFDDLAASSGASTNSWNQGDLLCYDTSNFYLRAVTATGDGLSVIGIADQTVTSGKLAGPYDGLTQNNTASYGLAPSGPKYGVVAQMKLVSGVAYNFGCKVFLTNTDAQTVSSTGGDTNYVGVYVGPTLASAGSAVRGACLIGARWPAATGTGLNF